MTSCECGLCLCKVDNGKVGIMLFCVKRSGQQDSTWAGVKAAVSQEIKPSPSRPRAQNPWERACHRVTQRRQEVFSNAYPGTGTGQHFELPALHFKGVSKEPWSAKSEHQRMLLSPLPREAPGWHIESDGSLKLSAGTGHPAEQENPPGAKAKSLTRCCPCCNIDARCNVWKASLNCPLLSALAQLTFIFFWVLLFVLGWFYISASIDVQPLHLLYCRYCTVNTFMWTPEREAVVFALANCWSKSTTQPDGIFSNRKSFIDIFLALRILYMWEVPASESLVKLSSEVRN